MNTYSWRRHWRKNARSAFTLIELLTVMAIIGILAAIIIPTISSARTSANKAKTKVLFQQLTIAMEQFRQEYGFYPNLGAANKLSTAADTLALVRTLTGKNLDGTTVASVADLNGNTRRISFFTFSSDDLQNGLLTDPFGNTEFGLLWDKNGDGVINISGSNSDGTLATLKATGGSATFTPEATDFSSPGLRASVAWYTVGKGETADQMVLSWK